MSNTEFLPQQVLEMAEKCKVRKDFDPTKEYSVDVSNCTDDEKRKVQQAFFDAGFPWKVGGKKYQHLYAEQYSNTTGDGHVTKFCMFSWETEECNMTAEEFLDLVYEPVQQGHVHAESMALYAEDAKTTDKPWELWQVKDIDGIWDDHNNSPIWLAHAEYRRKPKTKLIHGVEIPDIGIDLSLTKERTDFYTPTIHSDELFFGFSHHHEHNDCSYLSALGITYPFTEEGKQAAILHAKAMLGID